MDKTAFKRMILPPPDSILPLHPSSLFCIESTNDVQSIPFNLIVFIVMPNYDNGKEFTCSYVYRSLTEVSTFGKGCKALSYLTDFIVIRV